MINHSASSGLAHELRIPFQREPLVRYPLHRSVKRYKREHGVLTLHPGKKPFTIIFDGDTIPLKTSLCQVVRVESVDEAMRLLMLLGDTCEIFLSAQYRLANQEVYALLKALSDHSQQDDDSSFNIDNTAALLKKLPLDIRGLLHGPLAIMEEDAVPDPLKKEIVHKKDIGNVLISDMYRVGKFMHFNMFSETSEISFDHNSDHIQGMVILEALRQASTATVHLAENGLPEGGKISLLQYHANFYNYLSKKAPVIIRTFNTFSIMNGEKDKNGFVVSQVFQWGKLCVETILKGQSIKDQDRFEQLSRFTEKVTSRNKAHFDAQINLMRTKSLSV
ncbi:MAG: hypothetical protein HGB23_04595 [Chlorobiaceae bacterium]|nr:hypothetical protein [Chlorobiaceae bacterium]